MGGGLLIISLIKMNHIHIGFSISGSSGVREELCFSNVDDAFEYFRIMINEEMSESSTRCTGHCAQSEDFEFCGECDSCHTHTDCAAVLGAIADGDAQHQFIRDGNYGLTVSDESGTETEYWVRNQHRVPVLRENCTENIDQ